ncbi:hypothetical protein V6N13_097305 [Hibiscus sabdariffa]
MHKPLQRNLARYRELGNGVIGSTAQAFPCPSADHARGIRYRSKATLPLTIPRRVFKSSAKDSTRRSVEITLQGGTRDLSDARAAPTTRALGGHRPLLRVGNRATGACVASSPDSDLEAFSHNPAHGSFAPLAFQPSAMTNCANQRSKGSIGHAFTVRIRTGNQNQTSFYPFVPHEISVLVELHLRTPALSFNRCARPSQTPHLTMSSARIDRPKPALGPKRGQCPASDSRNKPPKEPFPVRPPAGTRRPAHRPREQLEQCTGSRRVRDWDPRAPALRANPFPEVTDPFCRLPLPTLFHRPEAVHLGGPDAVMSTTGRGRHSVLRIFKGRRGRTGHHATCGALSGRWTLPPAEPFPGVGRPLNRKR